MSVHTATVTYRVYTPHGRHMSQVGMVTFVQALSTVQNSKADSYLLRCILGSLLDATHNTVKIHRHGATEVCSRHMISVSH